MTWACPECGATEGMFHGAGCKLRPAGVRECCRTPWYLDPEVVSSHEPWCQWEDGSPRLDPAAAEMSRAAWRDLP